MLHVGTVTQFLYLLSCPVLYMKPNYADYQPLKTFSTFVQLGVKLELKMSMALCSFFSISTEVRIVFFQLISILDRVIK